MNELENHVNGIDDLNQRGGRMLSVVDLIEAGTLGRDLAAHLLAAIGAGASFMVGARPGGAGKTTVMGALLNMIPSGVLLVTADGGEAIRQGIQNAIPRRVYVAHEIGKGRLYAYLWGAELRSYFELPRKGHILATNLHADTLEEARDQICAVNGVSAGNFNLMNIGVFLRFEPETGGREIVEAWQSDGKKPHLRIYANGKLAPEARSFVSAQKAESAAETVGKLLSSKARTVREVRSFVMAERASRGPEQAGPRLG